MKFVFLFLLLIVVFVISITFGANNDQHIVFNYLVGESEFRLSTILALLFGLGFLVAWLFAGYFYFIEKIKLSSALRKLKKLQSKYYEEITNRPKV
ncbi:LapA family protein [Frischella perrara]|jgi:Predicted membrane protein|uniref:LapA family protein n=1 Tax=Frischella perrara TaxID=1267021 RepID=UPI0023F51FBB|nr:lipopolysaccharide assembly protein LapA domain-containing protein [Frischella perrara]